MLAVNLCVMHFRHLFVLEMRGEDISDFVKGQMYALRRYAQWSYGQIANVLHINYQTVARYLQREVWQLSRKGHCGIVRKTTRRFDRTVVRLSTANPRRSAVDIHKELVPVADVSCKTVCRRLKEQKIWCRKCAVKPKLDDNHKLARYQWALNHRTWDLQWEKVIFSDEMHCSTSPWSMTVWRKTGTRYCSEMVNESCNRSIANVSVWAAFSMDFYSPLVRIVGQNSAQSYIQILQTHLLPLCRQVGNGALYQQDNAPIHRARLTRMFLADNNINTLPWPAISADINPIENLWSMLKAHLHQQPPPLNNDHLFRILQQKWDDLMSDAHVRAKYVYSMLHRIDHVLKARGGYTKY